VKDSGIGIPAESIKKIWDRFYKTDLSRGKDKRGTGLGLAIVKELFRHTMNISTSSAPKEWEQSSSLPCHSTKKEYSHN